MYHLLSTSSGMYNMYNIYSDEHRDTAGGNPTLEQTFREFLTIGERPNRYADLADFMATTSFKTILRSFEDRMSYDEFQLTYPELLI